MSTKYHEGITPVEERLRFYSDNKYLRWKRGDEASLEHLTPASVEALKDIEDEFNYGDPSSERELLYSTKLDKSKSRKRVRISKEYEDRWNGSRISVMSLSADILPYFSLCFTRVINTDNCDNIPDEIVEEFGKGKISTSPSSTSLPKRRERINNRDDRFSGYLLVRPDKTEKYFTEELLNAAVDRGIETQALEWITKDDEYVESVVG